MAQKGGGKGNLTEVTSKGKPSGRAKTVARIKTKVESGRYRVQPKKVADKMVDDAVRSIRSRAH